jgi:hypothetical protein
MNQMVRPEFSSLDATGNGSNDFGVTVDNGRLIYVNTRARPPFPASMLDPCRASRRPAMTESDQT